MIISVPVNEPLVLLGEKDKKQKVWLQVIGAKVEAEIYQDKRGLVIVVKVSNAISRP